MTQTCTPSAFTPKDWTARWAISLTTTLYSLRMRNEIDIEMRHFSRRMPAYHAVLVGRTPARPDCHPRP